MVYRGRRIPGLVGHYVFADYCSSWLRSFRYRGGKATDLRELPLPDRTPVSSFGVDAEGEIYVLSHEGAVLKLVPDR